LHGRDDVAIEQPCFDELTPDSIMDTSCCNFHTTDFSWGAVDYRVFCLPATGQRINRKDQGEGKRVGGAFSWTEWIGWTSWTGKMSSLSMASMKSMVWAAGGGAGFLHSLSKDWNGGAGVFPSIGKIWSFFQLSFRGLEKWKL
jgi:hypothetical protein